MGLHCVALYQPLRGFYCDLHINEHLSVCSRYHFSSGRLLALLLFLCFLKADLYDMCMTRQTAVVVFPDGRDAAAIGLRRGSTGASPCFHCHRGFFLSVDKYKGNKYDEDKQVCMTQILSAICKPQRGCFFLCLRGETALKCQKLL